MDLVLGPQRMMLRSTEKESTYPVENSVIQYKFDQIRRTWIESSTVLKFYVQYWRDYSSRLDTLGLGPSTRLVQLWTRYVELDLSGQSEWLEINCEIFGRVRLESTYTLPYSEVLHSWRFEPWSNIYLDLGIRCGFPPAVCRFPHLCIYKIVEK